MDMQGDLSEQQMQANTKTLLLRFQAETRHSDYPTDAHYSRLFAKLQAELAERSLFWPLGGCCDGLHNLLFDDVANERPRCGNLRKAEMRKNRATKLDCVHLSEGSPHVGSNLSCKSGTLIDAGAQGLPNRLNVYIDEASQIECEKYFFPLKSVRAKGDVSPHGLENSSVKRGYLNRIRHFNRDLDEPHFFSHPFESETAPMLRGWMLS
jgi:hypothetical protein